MAKLSLRDFDVRGKRVLVRVDFNVPTETRSGKIRVTLYIKLLVFCTEYNCHHPTRTRIISAMTSIIIVLKTSL